MKKKFLIVFVICFGLVLFSRFTLYQRINKSLYMLSTCFAYPLIKVHYAIAYFPTKVFQTISTMRSNKEMYTSLEQKYYALLSSYIEKIDELYMCKEMHELLRDQIMGQENKYLVHIIQKNITPHSHYFIVDAGSVKGIREDMVAIYKQCLVGRVTHVTPFYSVVTLITDRSCKIAVRCDKTGATALYEGTCSDQGALHHVSHLQPLALDDLVLSSGQGLIFPRGLAVGTISAYAVQRVTYTVEVAPILDLQKVSYCYLIQKGDVATNADS